MSNENTSNITYGGDNPWNEYRRLIMSELERLNHKHDEISQIVESKYDLIIDKIAALDKRLTILETKAAIIGTIAGMIGYFIPKLIEMFFK